VDGNPLINEYHSGEHHEYMFRIQDEFCKIVIFDFIDMSGGTTASFTIALCDFMLDGPVGTTSLTDYNTGSTPSRNPFLMSHPADWHIQFTAATNTEKVALYAIRYGYRGYPFVLQVLTINGGYPGYISRNVPVEQLVYAYVKLSSTGSSTWTAVAHNGYHFVRWMRGSNNSTITTNPTLVVNKSLMTDYSHICYIYAVFAAN